MKKTFLLVFAFIVILYIFYSTNFNSNFLNYSASFIFPTSYTSISSEFGYRTLYGVSNFHDGIDFLAPQGSDVIASSSGYVSYASFMQGYGNTIIITHENGIKTLYGHLSEEFSVSVGQSVLQGQIIAQVGPKYLSNGNLNGNTTGPHLHFTVIKDNEKINPLDVLENK